MAYLNPLILDSGLNVLTNDANRLDICSSLPGTYVAATDTVSLGNKTSISVGAPADATPTGRKVTVAAISEGDITATGTASHWAITDTVNSRLLAAGPLDNGQAVTENNKFNSSAFDITMPGLAA